MLMRNRIVLLALASSFVLVCACGIALAKDPFVGKWKVTISPGADAMAAGQKEIKDTLVFDHVKFHSEAFNKQNGFGPVAYELDTRGAPSGISAFTAEPTNSKGDTAKFTGNKSGSAIKGNIVWKKKDGTEWSYTYAGERE